MSDRRFTDKAELNPAGVWGLSDDHPAMTENRTLFPSTVVDVTADAPERLLISGRNNRKLGAVVEKGQFKGYGLFSLSLEERATCPTDCRVRDICYGNGMQLARRHRIGDPDVFFDRLAAEIFDLLDNHDGLLIRLHVLGDFPSVEYVSFWADALEESPNLAVYGYTSRATSSWGGDEIGDAIQAVKDRFPDRFRIRWSAPVSRPDGALVIDHIPESAKTEAGIVCPVQTDTTACCATCGLCWENSRDTILFVKHGRQSDSVVASSVAQNSDGIRNVEALKFPKSVVPRPIEAPTPEVRLVEPDELLIEAAYQRDLSGASIGLIRKILTGWDWTKFKPPVCADTADGFFVIDGQHTAIAAASHPAIVKIPIIVVQAVRAEKRAEAFVAHNRDRLAMSPFQVFHAEAAAGDALARDVLEIARRTGAVIPRSAPARGRAVAGCILPIADVRRTYAQAGPEVVDRIFRIAVGAEVAPLGRLAFRALRSLMTLSFFSDAAQMSDSRISAGLRLLPDLERDARAEAARDPTGSAERVAAIMILDACKGQEVAG